ncbi:MAG: hypothetical protein A2W91_19215 [Bacteroidetes bacterium GWF2_38_335]|nr:MAG: hypothetical protein A2W91_19215 [Bacteroidetes bacterium GWF2_38_335]OFY79890.1 MAG: hypothetical protein A2281_10615 [Bacteroidetes bacterium RIFOXYA12_FULL_38_20]HBS86345.1 hypothetical protein [Bacteroidales bacterium]
MLKDILSIAGQPGLFKMVSQTKNGIIVESLETKKRIPAYTTSKVSALEDIAIYTESEEVALKEVFKRIAEKENKGLAVDPKSSSDNLKAYFEAILPEYDREKVYVSDIKKVIVWYNLLQKMDLLNFDEKSEESEESAEIEEKPAEEVKE